MVDLLGIEPKAPAHVPECGTIHAAPPKTRSVASRYSGCDSAHRFCVRWLSVYPYHVLILSDMDLSLGTHSRSTKVIT